jgi:hypothetical protein
LSVALRIKGNQGLERIPRGDAAQNVVDAAQNDTGCGPAFEHIPEEAKGHPLGGIPRKAEIEDLAPGPLKIMGVRLPKISLLSLVEVAGIALCDAVAEAGHNVARV